MSFEYIQRLERELLILKKNNLFLKSNANAIRLENTHLLNINNELMDENKKVCKKLDFLINKYRCVVCYENPKNVILHTCFHFCLCTSCLSKLDSCPVCREPIDTYNVIF